MEEFFPGAIAGAAGFVIGHPIEVVKVQLQVYPSAESAIGGGSLRWACQAVLNKGLINGVFRGMTLPLASLTAVNAVFFGVYSRALSYLETLRPDCHFSNVMLSGMAGGAAQLPLITPIELVKTTMQAQVTATRGTSEYFRGPFHCANLIVRRHGLLGLNRGFAVTLVRDVPSYGLHMLTYDWLTQALTNRLKGGDSAAVLLAGGFAGSLSWLSITPIDVVKSNLQAEAASGECRSSLAVAKQLYSRHGLMGFYKGGLVLALRSFPVNAATFFVWEYTARLMRCDQQTDMAN